MSAQELLGRFRSRVAPGLISARPSARGGVRRRRRGRLLASTRARRLVLATLALVAVLGGGWLWLRDSSLVAVKRVTVTGVSGPDARPIRSALVAAARTMSTLDVHVDRLRTAVAPYPIVRDVRVSTQFPHGMRIHVVEQIPVATVSVAGRMVPVAGDGTLLHDAAAPPSLPVLGVGAPPGGPRLTEADALSAVALLAAAPYPLLAKISQVSHSAAHGLTVQLRSGPVIYFGDGSQLAAKWQAAIAVLADPGSRGAAYVDVTDPQRPAAGAGGGAGPATAAGQSTTGTGPSPASASAPSTATATATAAGTTATAAGTTATAAGTTAADTTAQGSTGQAATAQPAAGQATSAGTQAATAPAAVPSATAQTDARGG
jgi:cell division protein FtsQ